MSRDVRVRLDDVVRYADEAIAFVAGMSYDEFAADRRTQMAVLYALLVVGEATKHVPDAVRARAPDSGWTGAARFRDQAAHGYDTLDLPTVWDIGTRRPPPYREQVAALVAALDAAGGRAE